MSKVHSQNAKTPPASGSTCGPTAQEWSRHREEIISLYQNRPLDEVRRKMKEKYNFNASKRMFDQRFKQWKVSKNINRTRKEIMARQIALATQTGQNVDMSAVQFRKVMRYVQSQSRKTSRSPLPQLSIETPDASPTSSTGTIGQSSSMFNSSPMSSAQGRRSLSTRSSVSPFTRDATLYSVVGSHFSEEETTDIPPVEKTRPLSPGFRNIEFLTSTVIYYFEGKLADVFGDIKCVPGSEPSSPCKQFWSNIENGIYLWKIKNKFPDRRRRAFHALDKACSMTQQALIEEPMDFIRRLFYTLSPTNTTIFPPLRRSLLEHIKQWAAYLFGNMHPLALISDALMKDDNSAELSQRILYQMYATSSERLGNSHAVTYKLYQSIITIARRAGELESAKSLAESGLELVRMDRDFQSDEVRAAARDLAQILTQLNEHGRAQELRTEIVQTSDSQDYHKDAISVHTLEDIAEHHDVVLNDPLRSAECLQRALGIAVLIWGKTVATQHIKDKLDAVLERISDTEDQTGSQSPEIPAATSSTVMPCVLPGYGSL